MPRFYAKEKLVKKLYYDEDEKCCWQIHKDTSNGTILYKYKYLPSYKVTRKEIPYNDYKFNIIRNG